MIHQRMRRGVRTTSLLAALLLGLMPLPLWLQPLRPNWLALVVAFWVIATPERAGLGFAFAVGLLADLVFGSLLGEQALRLLLLAAILQRFRAQLRFFPLFQQMLLIGALLFLDRTAAWLLHWMLGLAQLPWTFWFSPLPGMALWIPVFVLLDRLRHHRRKPVKVE